MRNRLAALLVFLFVLTMLPLPRPALGQGDPVVLRFDFAGTGEGSAQGWFYTADFDQEGGAPVEGVRVRGNGLSDARCPDDGWCIGWEGWGNTPAGYFTAVYSLLNDIEIQHIEWVIDTLGEGLGRYATTQIYTSAMQKVYDHDTNISGAGGAKSVDHDLSAAPITGRYVVIHAYTQWDVTIDWVELTVGSAPEKNEPYTFPLAQGEYSAPLHLFSSLNEGQITPFVQPLGENEYLLAYASEGLQLIHSPTSGVITDISPFTEAECNHVISAAPSDIGAALAAIGAAINPLIGAGLGAVIAGDMLAWQNAGSTAFCSLEAVAWLEPGLLDQMAAGLEDYYVPIAGDLVTIQSAADGNLLTYLMMDSEIYIQPGSFVSAGCVMGITLPIWWGRIYPAPQYYIEKGYGTIWATDSAAEIDVNIADQFRDYPNGDLPCSMPTFTDCLNANPNFESFGTAYSGWKFKGSDLMESPAGETSGIVLSQDGIDSAIQAFPLTEGEAYSIKVVARVQTPNSGVDDSEIIVSLGTTSHPLEVPVSGERTQFMLDPQTYTADIGAGVYTLAIELAPGEDGEIVIEYLCVSPNADPALPRPNCLFTNSGFDPPGAGWTLTEATINGALLLPSSASQTITLAADTYTLEVKARGGAISASDETITSAGGSTADQPIGTTGGLPSWKVQSFTTGSAGTLTGFSFNLGANTGSPTGTVTWELHSDSAGGVGSLVTSGTFSATASATNTVPIADGPSLAGSTVYWVALRPTSAQSNGNYWTWKSASTSIYSGGWRGSSSNSGASWSYDTSNFTDHQFTATIAPNTIPELDWSLTPNGGGDPLADGDYALTSDWQQYTSATFTLGSAADGATFEVASATQVDVDYVCLIPTNQPTAPPEPDYPDVRDCNSCPIRLTGDVAHDVYESAAWHDCRFRQLYYCDMRKILVDIRTNTAQTVRGIGMFGRYTGATIAVQFKFLQGMAYYLAGYLNNVALAIQDSIAWQTGYSTVVTGDGALGFWDVLGLLISSLRDVLVTALDRLAVVISQLFSFLAPIVGTLLAVLESAVNILSTMIQTVLDQLQILQYLIAAIVTGANNATPEAIPGAPNCSATPEGLCWGIYILDNTIFSGPVKGLLPILAGAMTLNLLVWTIGKFRHVFENLG